MSSLGLLEQIYSVLFILLLAGVLIPLFFRIRTLGKERMSIADPEVPLIIRISKSLLPMGWLFLALGTPFMLFIASPLGSLVPGWSPWALWLTILGWMVVGILLRKKVTRSTVFNPMKKIAMMAITVFLLVSGLYILFKVPDIYAYPSTEKSLIVDLPVRGTWSAGHAGGTTLVNYHCAYPSQRYAMDIVKVNEDYEFYKNEGLDVEDFYTLDENIYSPVDGTVAYAEDGHPNEAVSFAPDNPENPAGNHVVIRISDSAFVYLAHLNNGSVAVKEGDVVRRGDLIGRAGNSGNTSWPHLHMHIQNIPEFDMKRAEALPYRFSKIRRRRIAFWHTAENAYLLRNDLFSDAKQAD